MDAIPQHNTFPVVLRRGWLHCADGDVIAVRDLYGDTVQKLVEGNAWLGVAVGELGRIEWDEG